MINLLQMLPQFTQLRFEDVKPNLRISRFGFDTRESTLALMLYSAQVAFGQYEEPDTERKHHHQQHAYQ